MITLTAQLQAANDLLNETAETLKAKTVKELRQDAQVLNIKGYYKMSKAQVMAAVLGEIEKLQAMMAAAGVQAEKSKTAVVALKAEGGHLPVSEVVGKTYEKLRKLQLEEVDFDHRQSKILSLAGTVAGTELKEYQATTATKTRRPEIHKGLQDKAHLEIDIELRAQMLNRIQTFHKAMCDFQRSQVIRFDRSYKESTQSKNIAKKEIAIAPLVAECRETVAALMRGESPHWTKVSVAIVMGTGRRSVETHCTAEFTVIGDYKLHFKGQAKTRGADNSRDEFNIPTLFPAAAMKRALDYLAEQGRRLPKSDQEDNTRAVNKAYGMALSRAMKKYPFSRDEIRKFYAELMWQLHGSGNREKHTYFSEIMGHSDLLGGSNSTFRSYLVYEITDTAEALQAVEG